jgi:Helix-turn-helix domain
MTCSAAGTTCRGTPKLCRRPKEFGHHYAQPLDREAKRRLFVKAQALSHATEPGKHYGQLTGKFLDVLKALLWGFHNAGSGLCFPSYEAIAAAAHTCRDTVRRAIAALEAAGLLSWCNRLVRVREHGVVRVLRTSNGYQFVSKAEIQPRSSNQFSTNTSKPAPAATKTASSQLELALSRLQAVVKSRPPT